MTQATLIAVIVCILGSTLGQQDWGYEGRFGPQNWQGACKGKSQSPINLPTAKAIYRREEPFVFKNYDAIPDKIKLRNEGKTVKLTLDFKDKAKFPQISQGGLPSTFEFAQAHLHWAETDEAGSEHLVDDVSYPAELHLVHFNKKYGDDLVTAISSNPDATDSLAVLGVMLNLNSQPNDMLNPIVKALRDIPNPEDQSYIKLFPLADLLPAKTDSFFRYNGSLTTPGCNEIVVWTVFRDSIAISSEQMSLFRETSGKTVKMQNNYRPVQPLNGRTLLEIETSSASLFGLSGLICFVSLTLSNLLVRL